MRSLADLLATPAGVALLAERGVFADHEEFARRLEPPRSPDLADLVGGARDIPLVFVGQQLCTDLLPVTAAKFVTLRDCAATHAMTPVVLWHDMDSVRSERFGARVVLGSGKRRRGVWLTSSDVGDIEPRFIVLDRERVESAFTEISALASASPEGRARARRLATATDHARTLADATRTMADVLVREQIGLVAPSATTSDLVASGLLVGSVQEYIANVDDVVRVFNERLDELIALDVDPQLRPLDHDHLPLRYSCPDDDTRIPLKRERDEYAVGTCPCGRSFAFHLTDGELWEGGRWSIDASLPVHHNDLAGGWVAGRSTALYALMYNAVLARVLGRRPIPILVPPSLPAADDAETVLTRYLTAGTQAPAPAAA